MQNRSFTQKQKVIQSIRQLNLAIMADFVRLKQQFESKQINSTEISNTLKTWKSSFEQSVQNNLKQLKELSTLHNPLQQFNYSVLVKQLTRTYGTDQQYIEAIKCLNSTTDMLKDYIRIKAIKDPTTAVIQKQLVSNQTVLLGSARTINL